MDVLLDAQRLAFLLRERLDLADAGEVVVQRGVELAQLVLPLAERRAHVTRKAAHRQHDQRDRQHRQQRQLPVHGKQHRADPDQRQHVDQHVGDGVGDQLLEHVRVVDHARHQLAGLLVLVEAQREALQMLVDVLADVCHDAPAGHVRLVGADELQARPHNVKAQQQKRQPRHERHGLRVPGGLVRNRPDQIPDDPGHQQLHPDQQRHADHGEGERHDVAAAIGQKKLQSSHEGSWARRTGFEPVRLDS